MEPFHPQKSIPDKKRHSLLVATYNLVQSFFQTTMKNEWILPEPILLEITADQSQDIEKTIYGEVTISLITDDDKNSIGFVGITKDITKQKRTENALIRSEAIYRTLIKASPDAIVIIDKDGDILKSNNQAASLARQDRNEMIGDNYEKYISPDKREIMRLSQKKLLDTGRIDDLELTFLRKDETTFSGEVSIAAIEEKDEKIEAFVAVLRDITKRKKTEIEIKKSSERYQNLLEAMIEGLIIIDKNNLFTYINPSASEIFGYSFEDLLGKPISSIFNNKSIKIIEKKVEQTKNKNKSKKRFELDFNKKNGDIVHSLFSLNNIYGDNGDYLGTFAVITDITKEKNI